MLLNSTKFKLDKILEKLVTAVPGLRDFSMYFAGGCMSSMLRDERPNDYDLWFHDCKSAHKFIKRLSLGLRGNPIRVTDNASPENMNEVSHFNVAISEGLWTNQGKDEYLRCVSETAATYVVDGVKYQIVFMTWGSPKEVIGKFDFEHTRAAYNPAPFANEPAFEVGERFFECCAARALIYRAGVAMFPLSSMIRAAARQESGWHVPGVEWVKLAFDISKLDLADPAVLRKQLKGVDVVILKELVRRLDALRTGEKVTLDWFMDQLRELKLI